MAAARIKVRQILFIRTLRTRGQTAAGDATFSGKGTRARWVPTRPGSGSVATMRLSVGLAGETSPKLARSSFPSSGSEQRSFSRDVHPIGVHLA